MPSSATSETITDELKFSPTVKDAIDSVAESQDPKDVLALSILSLTFCLHSMGIDDGSVEGDDQAALADFIVENAFHLLSQADSTTTTLQ